MTTHQQKKLERDDLIAFRKPLRPAALRRAGAELAFYRPADDSPEMRYLLARRRARRQHPQRRAEAPPVPVRRRWPAGATSPCGPAARR